MRCQHADWSPIAGATAKSAFAALLAGFVFACLVTLINSRGQGRPEDTITIRLFIAAFLCLVADSFVALQLSGTLLCQRAWAESVIYNSLLAIGVVAILSGLAWLISGNAMERTSSLEPRLHADLQRFVVRLTYAVAAITVVFLQLGARGYLRAVSADRAPHTWYGWITLLYAPTLLILAAVLIPFGRRARTQRRITGDAALRRLWLQIAAASTSLVVLGEVVMLAIIGNLPPKTWNPPSSWLVALGATAPPLLAAIPLITLVLALPLPTRHDPSTLSG